MEATRPHEAALISASGPPTGMTLVSTPVRLDVSGVSKSWGAQRVLDSVDFAAEAGALAAVVGDNGTGKTTLLRIVAGLIAPDEGSVAVDGFVPFRDRREYQQRVGLVSAGSAGLYARFSVRRHLEHWAAVAFVPRRERRTAVEEALARFALGAIADQRADRLSMGQRQRVRLAMAFLHEPKLVLLDEPSNSLDADGLALLRDALSRLLASGGAAIWCAPTPNEVSVPADRVYRLAEGRLT
jgi:ABC-2 type transport system ATP-binding protein